MFKFKIGEKVDKIITIENKANYYDYISSRKNNNELVIYHGGCYSPSKALFFKKIVNVSNSKTTFFHWGDIDFGGFSMLKRLRLNINCDFKPYKMEKKDLIYNFSYTQSFSEMYAKKLQGLLDCDVLNDCKECIKYMLDKKVRLEQEIMI